MDISSTGRKRIDETTQVIAKRIDELREEHGETVQAIADMLGLSYSFTRDILKGRKRPSPENLIKIAEHYKVNLDYLYGRSDKREMKDLVWEDEQLSTLFRATAGLSKEDLEKVNAMIELMFGDDDKTDDVGDKKHS